MEKENVIYTHKWNTVQPLKKRNPTIVITWIDFEGKVITRNKPDTERQIMHDPTYV